MGFSIKDGVLERYTDDDNCKDVVIPDGVTIIDSFAFEDSNFMASVTVPPSVYKIDSRAFDGCTRLKKVIFASDSIEICSDAFEYDTPWWNNKKGEMIIVAGTLMKYLGAEADLVIPEGVVYIAAKVFKGHTEIESITFPSSLRKIGFEAFRGCTSLKKVDVPLGVTNIGGGCFSGCTGLVDVKLPDGIKYLSGTFRDCTHLKDVTIPNTVESISSAFDGCSLMENITLPESLQVLGGWSAGTQITKIHIPSKVREIEYFGCKTQIEEITVDENNQTFTSVDGVVYSKDMRCLHIYPCCKQDDEFIVPESVRFFSDSAFSYIMHLKRVVLHKDIIYNYDYDGWEMYRSKFNNVWRFPFDNCCSIEKVEGLPNRYIDSHYFDLPAMYADKIIDKILNSQKDDRTEYIHKTTAISADLIARKAIETIMQSSVSKKTISNLAELFDYHRNSISAKTFSEFYKIIIDKKAENCLGLIPFTTIIALKEKSGDPDTELIKNMMKKAIDSSKGIIPDAKQFCKVESCELVSLAENSGLTVLKLPSNVKRIREVFSKYGYFNYRTKQYEYPDFSGIKKIIIPKATERIDTLELLVDLEEIEVDPQNELFMSINGLLLEKSYKGVYLKSIPAALKKMCIPKVCTSLSNVDLTNIEDITVEEGNEVFEYNNGYLTEKVEGKTDLIFVKSDIEDIIAPDGVTYFDLSNNGNKDHIKSIIMPDSVIGGSGVFECRGLKYVRISSGIKKLKSFKYLDSLEEVVIPEGVEEICEDCFYDCKSLKKVTLPSTLKKIYAHAFDGCTSLTEVSVPEGVKTAASSFPKKCKVNNSEFVGGIKYAADFPVEFDEEAIDFVFKSGVTEIPDKFFAYEPDQFFHDIRHFDSVYISDTVVKLDAQQLSNFAQITVDEKNSEFSSADGVLFDKEKTVLLRFPVFKRCDEYVIPDTVKRIEDSAFEWCRRIKSVVIPEGVTYIGESAFALCDELAQIKVPFTATEIGSAAFVTEDNCNKAQRRDVTLSFYKNDSIVPLKLKRNWNVFTEEKKLSQFIGDPKHHEKYLPEFKDADYKLAAAMIMYFLFDEKCLAEKTVRANIETVIDLAVEANSTGVIRKLLSDDLLTEEQRKKASAIIGDN